MANSFAKIVVLINSHSEGSKCQSVSTGINII